MRRVLVTGAASGIGAAVCRRLAGPGTAVLVHTRKNSAGAEAVAAQVREAGGQAVVAFGDLGDADVPAALVARAVATLGGLDVLVSNAGFADRTAFAALGAGEMQRSLDGIFWAFFRLVQAAAPVLAAGAAPRIVAVSSFVAHGFRTDTTLFPASAAAKAAVEALVRSLAVELGPQGITVNAVVPGFIRKEATAHAALSPAQFAQQAGKIPLGRIGLPDDVAAAIAFLASADAAYVTGQLLHVNGGLLI